MKKAIVAFAMTLLVFPIGCGGGGIAEFGFGGRPIQKTGTVEGQVITAEGVGVQARINVANPPREVMTDANGNFTITDLPAGQTVTLVATTITGQTGSVTVTVPELGTVRVVIQVNGAGNGFGGGGVPGGLTPPPPPTDLLR